MKSIKEIEDMLIGLSDDMEFAEDTSMNSAAEVIDAQIDMLRWVLDLEGE